MPNLATLKGYLTRAETHIVEGELRLARHSVRLKRLRAAGRDAGRSQILLREMERNLAA